MHRYEAVAPGLFTLPFSPSPVAEVCDATFIGDAVWVLVPQRSISLPSPGSLRALARAAREAWSTRPELERPARRCIAQCRRFEAARGADPVTRSVAAYAAHGWLRAAWLQPHLVLDEDGLARAAAASAAESGSTGSSGPAHLAPSFARFAQSGGAAAIAPAGLANPVTLTAMSAASNSRRVAVIGRTSLRAYSFAPPSDSDSPRDPPDLGFRPTGDATDPLSLYAASPFFAAEGFEPIADKRTLRLVEGLRLDAERATLVRTVPPLPAGLTEAEAARVPIATVVSARMIHEQHMRHPCRACAQGWCTIRRYALIAANFVLPFYRGLRPRGAMPRPRAQSASASHPEVLAHGRILVANELLAGISRLARPGEEFVHIYSAFVAFKPLLHPSDAELDALVASGRLVAHAEALVRQMLPHFLAVRARNGRISTAAFSKAIQPFLTEKKARLVHDQRQLNKRLAGWHMSFPFLDEILALIEPGSWIGLHDWLSGFSNLVSHPDNDKYMAYIYDGMLLVKTVMAFGGMSAPPNFGVLSAEVNAVVHRRIAAAPRLVEDRANSSVHVDDHFFTAASEESCEHVGAIVEDSVAGAGGTISKKKALRPSQRQQVHGVLIDTVAGTLSVPNKKRYNYIALMLLLIALNNAGCFTPVQTVYKVVGRNTYVAGMLHGARLELGPQHEELQRMLGALDAGEQQQPLAQSTVDSFAYLSRHWAMRRGASRHSSSRQPQTRHLGRHLFGQMLQETTPRALAAC